MSTVALDRYTVRTAAVVPAAALAGLTTFLFVRLLPDVTGKPLHEDEAVSGLVAVQPLDGMLQTVVDRGGAPLHFVLGHFVLAAHPSPETLRWLSVVFALAMVPLCFDLARRIAGALAGFTAAALAATSQLLLVYGTFGRMYSLFAFASALAADLFVRAFQRPARRTAAAAIAAGALVLAVHPFGVFLYVAGAVVAISLWRRAAVIAAVLTPVPLLLLNVGLFDRYGPEANTDAGTSAMDATVRALGGAAGGKGLLFVAFAAVGIAGLFAVPRAVAAFAALAIAFPPVVLALAQATGMASDRLGPRHLIFTLPLWLTLVAAGATRLLKPRLPLVLAVVVAAALAPSAIPDPRTDDRDIAAAATHVRERVAQGDVLYPYSSVFLAALPEVAVAKGLPREPVALARAAERTREVEKVFLSLPTHDSWRILERRGPFGDGRAVLAAIVGMLRSAPRTPYRDQLRAAACAALSRLGSGCQPVATSTDGTSPQRSSSR